jgi:beta-lactamase class A
MAGALALSAGLAARPALAREVSAELRAIEARVGGRLGLCAGRPGREPIVAWRSDERFLMCSTFKALAVSAVLARVDAGRERLDRWIAYGRGDLLEYAPTATANLAKGGMSLGELCAAAVELSDNTAANLILASLGGPPAVTGYIRSLGDGVTRLDRTEPTLNDPGPLGDLHDTTTPASMAGLWRTILLGHALSPASRRRLMDWLEACQTGPARLKSITPAGWRIGHKTGAGSTTIGDVAILTRPGRPPILIAAYLDAPGQLDHPHDDAIARAGRLALGLVAPNA